MIRKYDKKRSVVLMFLVVVLAMLSIVQYIELSQTRSALSKIREDLSVVIENDTPWEVIQIGRQFLDERGYKTGRILFSKLEEEEPNFYWHNVFKIESEERPDIRELRSCWVIRFEQAKRPGHFFEVWIDASEHLVMGGMSCK